MEKINYASYNYNYYNYLPIIYKNLYNFDIIYAIVYDLGDIFHR